MFPNKEEKEGTIIANIANLFLGPAEKYEPIYPNEKPDSIVIKNGKIEAIGETGRILSDYLRKDYNYINCDHRKTIIPSFVDSHTHLVFSGNRSHELKMKIEGKTYAEIAKSGGGINYSVKATRAATKEELKQEALKRLDEMLLHGTTTIEAKSGYGLNQESEIKILEVMKEINNEHPIEIVPTFLGCHIKPDDFIGNTYEYIESMIELLPKIRQENLAEYVDIWTDIGAFTIEESEFFLKAAKEKGFKIRVHADELDNVGAGIMAANVGAVSADHLLKAEAITADAMAEKGVVANMLPGTPFVLMNSNYANHQMFKDAGCTIALSTDFNPNCYITNMQTILGLGSFMMRMTPQEALKAATYGGAVSLNREQKIGTIDLGMNADLLILDIPHIDNIIYQYGVNHVSDVLKNGKFVVENKQIVY